MIKLCLKGTETAHDAVDWCTKNIEKRQWDMWMSNRGWDIYDFEFENQRDALLFSLVWSEHTIK